MFAIICDARTGEGLGVSHLAFVNRAANSHRWWTSDNPDEIMCFYKREAAEYSLQRLRYNNPRIVSYAWAKMLIAQQRDAIRAEKNERMHEQAMAECDPYGHGQDFIPF